MSQSSNVSAHLGLVASGDSAVVTANQALSPSGCSALDSSAGAITACTLAVPQQAGIIKVLLQVGTGTNNVVVTSLFVTGTTATTTATMNAAGESLILVSTGTNWQILLNSGTVGLA